MASDEIFEYSVSLPFLQLLVAELYDHASTGAYDEGCWKLYQRFAKHLSAQSEWKHYVSQRNAPKWEE